MAEKDGGVSMHRNYRLGGGVEAWWILPCKRYKFHILYNREDFLYRLVQYNRYVSPNVLPSELRY